MARIVETITAGSMAELRARRDQETVADMLELRLDGVRDLDVAGALAGRCLPAIVTCRAAWEGGRFDGSEEERLRFLNQAVDLGAEFVDVEDRANHAAVRRSATTRLVLSRHDFEGMPADLFDCVRQMRQAGADVVKVAVTARTLRDCVTLKQAVDGDEAHVALAMGPAGWVTRLWPAWLGSEWTYGGTAAPGQVPTRELARRYRAATTSSATRAYAVLGKPIAHSASPAMLNAAFAHAGLDVVYLPLEVGCADEFFAVADALRLEGASVTAPMKKVVLTDAVCVDDLVTRIGALNTLKRSSSGGWEGRNFDVEGFLAPIARRAVPVEGQRACIVGAGGAARAVAWALVSAGARVEISARRREQADALAADLGAASSPWPPTGAWDLLINTTPVGTWPDVETLPFDADRVLGGADGRVVYDLVYNPEETALIRAARRAGATTIGGLDMLVSQACRQFEWWTNLPAPREVMEEAAREFLSQRSEPQSH
jgi:3-dehydroquinate dehydratase/shikimate dehydrogenase